VYTSDRSGRLVAVEHLTPEPCRQLQAQQAASAGPPPSDWEHDPAARVFRLAADDGTVEVFRDNPTRYLCVEPDPKTGAMRPVRKLGRPVYLYLCREEREAR
jgi:hypothetical protein